MKKIFSLFLAVSLIFLLSVGCSKTEENIENNTQNPETVNKDQNNNPGGNENNANDNPDGDSDINEDDFPDGSFESEYPIFNLVDEKDMPKDPVSFDYNGKTVTVKFLYTDITFTDTWPEKTYVFEDGAVKLRFRDERGSKYLTEDGKLITPEEYENSYKTDNEIYPTDILGKTMELPNGNSGRMIGKGLALDMTGEPGNYTQWLYNEKGELLTPTGFDMIGYFNNDGIAVIDEDKKVGFIDEKGNILLAPTIAHDDIQYSVGLGRTKGTSIGSFIYENAFIFSVQNKIVIATIE